MALEGIATSDWHLMGLKKIFPSGATDRQMIEIRKPFQYAVEHGIEHVFVPGDLSDIGQLDDHTLIALVTLILQYDEHVNSYYTFGNHDVEHAKKTSLDVLKVLAENGFFKNFKLYSSPEIVKIGGVHCCMMPYPHQKVLKAPKPPLVFAHVEVAGAVGDNGRLLKVHKEKLVRQPGDYVISGHIHQHQILKKQRFLYCGNPFQKTFGEALPKGFVKFNAKYAGGKLVVNSEFINSHPNFVLETKVINEISDWDTLVHDDGVRYKILVGEGIVVPKNITREFPNIVYLNGSSTRVKVTSDGQTIEGGVTIKDLPTFKITTGLSKYLKAAEFDKKKRVRALSLVKEAQSALGII